MFPRFRVNAHVAVYSLLTIGTVGPVLLYARYFGQSDEEKIEMLKVKYPEKYKESLQKRKDIQEFFDKMKNSENNKQFNEVLHGGRGEMKRQHSFDPNSQSDQEKQNS